METNACIGGQGQREKRVIGVTMVCQRKSSIPLRGWLTCQYHQKKNDPKQTAWHDTWDRVAFFRVYWNEVRSQQRRYQDKFNLEIAGEESMGYSEWPWEIYPTTGKQRWGKDIFRQSSWRKQQIYL